MQQLPIRMKLPKELVIGAGREGDEKKGKEAKSHAGQVAAVRPLSSGYSFTPSPVTVDELVRAPRFHS